MDYNFNMVFKMIDWMKKDMDEWEFEKKTTKKQTFVLTHAHLNINLIQKN